MNPLSFSCDKFYFYSLSTFTCTDCKATNLAHDEMKVATEFLLVLDSRTGKSYKIPIQDNFIQATDVGKVAISDANNEDEDADASVQAARPLRILDRGFENTACMMSSITVMYAMKAFPPPRLFANDLMKVMDSTARLGSGTVPLKTCSGNTFMKMLCICLFGGSFLLQSRKKKCGP